MLYQRIAAAAAVLLLLGGCSFFGFWDQPETPAEITKIGSLGSGGPLAGSQLAALPGYLSDEDVAPGGAPGGAAAIQGPIGEASVRPTRPSAAVQGPPIERDPTFGDLPPRRQVLDLQARAAAVEPGSFSLADLVADRDWRKRTSATLNHLLQ